MTHDDVSAEAISVGLRISVIKQPTNLSINQCGSVWWGD
jgi:hypothetical protein